MNKYQINDINCLDLNWCKEMSNFYINNPEFISGALTGGFFSLVEKQSLMKSFIGDLRNKRVLDIGCGFGQLSEIVFSMGSKEYYGVDITHLALNTARKNYPDAKFTYGDMHKLPQNILQLKYDVIFILDTLEHAKNPSIVLLQCKEILNNDGKIMIIIPNYANIAGILKIYNEKIGKYDKDSWSPFCEEKPQKFENLTTSFSIKKLLKDLNFLILHERGWDIIAAFCPTVYGDNILRGFWDKHSKQYWYLNRFGLNYLKFITSKISMYYFVSAKLKSK